MLEGLTTAQSSDRLYPEVDKQLFRQLATGRWIADHQNVIATGMTGVGKSYSACALGQLSCRLGLRVAYKRVPRLFEELALAHADGTYERLLARPDLAEEML